MREKNMSKIYPLSLSGSIIDSFCKSEKETSSIDQMETVQNSKLQRPYHVPFNIRCYSKINK